jgi:hypothetical protein
VAVRKGAVVLAGPAHVTLQHFYLEVGSWHRTMGVDSRLRRDTQQQELTRLAQSNEFHARTPHVAVLLPQWLQLQAGLNQPAAEVSDKAQLTCKDSLLVGWGGATDQDDSSCSIVRAFDQGTSLVLEGCTLQYHPDSKHSLSFYMVKAFDHAHVSLSQCRLVGPAPADASTAGCGVQAQCYATITLVGVHPV